MTAPVVCEVCIETAAGAVAAAAGGATRVELCADLLEGGTTPSAGTIRVARDCGSIELVVLIRPRAGDFVYDGLERTVMEEDVRRAVDLGADGVAVGALTADGELDRDTTARLIELARPAVVTFHRAFDLAADPRGALDQLVEFGVDRLLTSGQQPSAREGQALIAELVARAAGRIALVAGGGVRAHNVAALLAATGVGQVHFTARPPSVPGRTTTRRPNLGSGLTADESRQYATDADVVAAVVAATR